MLECFHKLLFNPAVGSLFYQFAEFEAYTAEKLNLSAGSRKSGAVPLQDGAMLVEYVGTASQIDSFFLVSDVGSIC